MQAIKGNKTGTYQDALLLEQKGELKAAAALYGILHKQAPKNIKILKQADDCLPQIKKCGKRDKIY